MLADKEIIQALECCASEEENVCEYCAYANQPCRDLYKDALDLINHQQAEIERLENKCEDCAGCTQCKCDYSNIKSEAVKEFAE